MGVYYTTQEEGADLKKDSSSGQCNLSALYHVCFKTDSFKRVQTPPLEHLIHLDLKSVSPAP